MRIVIETISHSEQRYSTIGDYWQDVDGTMQIRISEFENKHMALLVILHEFVECYLCFHRGIAEPDIKAFDEIHLDHDDPGHIPEAPYHREHVFAECLERLFAFELGVNWQEYERACERLFG